MALSLIFKLTQKLQHLDRLLEIAVKVSSHCHTFKSQVSDLSAEFIYLVPEKTKLLLTHHTKHPVPRVHNAKGHHKVHLDTWGIKKGKTGCHEVCRQS